jgi:hypothetical protein
MSRNNIEDAKLYSPLIESGLRLRSAAITITDNYVLDADSPPLLFLDAAGAVDLLMPAASEALKGLTFVIFNVSASTITLKTSGDAAFTTAIVLATLEGTVVVCTGSTTAALGWRALATALST